MGNVHMEATQINYREGDKKMSVAQAIKNAGNTGLAHTADIAPEFSTESAYSAGDFVYHNGSLYEFTANHAAGAWSTDDTRAATVGGKIASLEGDVSSLNDIKANQITIAPAFSAEASYDPGDLVYYNGLSYRCVNAHQGEWDADDFAATTISNELTSLMSGLTNLNNLNNLYLSFSAADMQDYLSQAIETFETNFQVGITVNAIGIWEGTCTFMLQVCRPSSMQTIISAIPQPNNYVSKVWVAMKESNTFTYSTIDMAVVS